MKNSLLICASLLVFSSCDSKDFQVGDCVQKPDSMVVWTVEEVSERGTFITQDQNPQMEKEKKIDSSNWIKTKCL